MYIHFFRTLTPLVFRGIVSAGLTLRQNKHVLRAPRDKEAPQ